MSAARSAFWDDLAADLKDPAFLRDYVRESVRIATIDRLVNELDEAREAAGLSKADLARAVSAQASVIRRLFSSPRSSPTVGTLAEVAAALGLELTLKPLPKATRAQVTEPLLRGRIADTRALARHMSTMRKQHNKAASSA